MLWTIIKRDSFILGKWRKINIFYRWLDIDVRIQWRISKQYRDGQDVNICIREDEIIEDKFIGLYRVMEEAIKYRDAVLEM